MDYQNTLKYLYESVPMFQQIGGKAYKPGLETTHRLDEHFGHPHQQFKTIHIAGTNGKGSCSHTIAAVLQSAGYRVGLFTSPHLIDFRERIRINGEMMPEEYVIRFVEEHRSFFEPLQPSFFELTTAMAFRYFADQKVDVAIIEVGMGGRLDCTNIIQPDLCVITNIGFDHMQYLGNTLSKIAKEKAGIMKEGVPVIIGRADATIKRAFNQKAKEVNAPIYYVEKLQKTYLFSFERQTNEELKQTKKELESLLSKKEITFKSKALANEAEKYRKMADPIASLEALNKIIEEGKDAIVISSPVFLKKIFMELSGYYQFENSATILCALEQLRKSGYTLSIENYITGFANVCKLTGLMGRWQKLQSHPDLICDTGHNADGIKWVTEQLNSMYYEQNRKLHIVFGMVNDKDINGVLELLPQYATYYFTKASVKRALPEDELLQKAQKMGLQGTSYPTVTDAVRAAKEKCLPEDCIFVGGSSFIVADLLTNRNALDLD